MEPDYLVPKALSRQVPIKGVGVPKDGYDHPANCPNGQLEGKDPPLPPPQASRPVVDRSTEGPVIKKTGVRDLKKRVQSECHKSVMAGILRLFKMILYRGYSSRVGLRLEETPPSQPIPKELDDQTRSHATVFLNDRLGSKFRLSVTSGPETDFYPRVVGIGLSSEVCSHDHHKVEETPHGCSREARALYILYSLTLSPNYGETAQLVL